MHIQLFGWLSLLVVILPSCSSGVPHISVACEENPKSGRGNCIIKWEVQPAITGKVKIYTSTDPNLIPEKDPIMIADISDQIAKVIINDPTQRYYYKMVFDNRFRVVTGSRNAVIPGIQNFRDLGGYQGDEGKETCWGKLYRSAQIESVSAGMLRELKNIGIKTIIDFRTPEEAARMPEMEKYGFKVVHLPTSVVKMSDIINGLKKNEITCDSAYRLIDRINCEMVMKCKKEYKAMFDVLADAENYPVLLTCPTGIGKTGIASALLLHLLGASDETIEQDYLRCNDFFDIPRITRFGYRLPPNGQEAITAFFKARKSALHEVQRQIEKEYGSVSAYLSEGLELTPFEVKQISAILLQ